MRIFISYPKNAPARLWQGRQAGRCRNRRVPFFYFSVVSWRFFRRCMRDRMPERLFLKQRPCLFLCPSCRSFAGHQRRPKEGTQKERCHTGTSKGNPFGPQSRFGNMLLRICLVCPLHGTAVLNGRGDCSSCFSYFEAHWDPCFHERIPGMPDREPEWPRIRVNGWGSLLLVCVQPFFRLFLVRIQLLLVHTCTLHPMSVLIPCSMVRDNRTNPIMPCIIRSNHTRLSIGYNIYI